MRLDEIKSIDPKSKDQKENVTDETKIIRIMREIARPAGMDDNFKFGQQFYISAAQTSTFNLDWFANSQVLDIASLYAGKDPAIIAALRAKSPRLVDKLCPVVDKFIKEVAKYFPLRGIIIIPLSGNATNKSEIPVKDFSFKMISDEVINTGFAYGRLRLVFDNSEAGSSLQWKPALDIKRVKTVLQKALKKVGWTDVGHDRGKTVIFISDKTMGAAKNEGTYLKMYCPDVASPYGSTPNVVAPDFTPQLKTIIDEVQAEIDKIDANCPMKISMQIKNGVLKLDGVVYGGGPAQCIEVKFT